MKQWSGVHIFAPLSNLHEPLSPTDGRMAAPSLLPLDPGGQRKHKNPMNISSPSQTPPKKRRLSRFFISVAVGGSVMGILLSVAFYYIWQQKHWSTLYREDADYTITVRYPIDWIVQGPKELSPNTTISFTTDHEQLKAVVNAASSRLFSDNCDFYSETEKEIEGWKLLSCSKEHRDGYDVLAVQFLNENATIMNYEKGYYFSDRTFSVLVQWPADDTMKKRIAKKVVKSFSVEQK